MDAHVNNREIRERGEDKRIFFHPLPIMHARTRERESEGEMEKGREGEKKKNLNFLIEIYFQ